MNDWFRDGAQAEYCVAKASEVVPKPRSVDHVRAAVTPISALTAWQGLVERARPAAAERDEAAQAYAWTSPDRPGRRSYAAIARIGIPPRGRSVSCTSGTTTGRSAVSRRR